MSLFNTLGSIETIGGNALANQMNSESVMKIPVQQIRPNPHNFYAHMNSEEEEQELIIGLANVLAEHGQDSHAIVYHDEAPNDGKKYTLISGERRYHATLYNYNQSKGDGFLTCKIIPKPESEELEIMHVIQNNGIRKKTPETRMKEIQLLSEMYDRLKQDGNIIGKKREWIGNQIGMSPRQVQEYLSGKTEPSLTDSQIKERQYKISTSKRISHTYGVKARIDTRFNLVFTPKDKTPEGMEALLSLLNLQDLSNDKGE